MDLTHTVVSQYRQIRHYPGTIASSGHISCNCFSRLVAWEYAISVVLRHLAFANQLCSPWHELGLDGAVEDKVGIPPLTQHAVVGDLGRWCVKRTRMKARLQRSTAERMLGRRGLALDAK